MQYCEVIKLKSSTLIRRLYVRIMISILLLFIMILGFSIFVVRRQFYEIAESNISYYNDMLVQNINEHFVDLEDLSNQIGNRFKVLERMDSYLNEDTSHAEMLIENNVDLKYSLKADSQIKSIYWFDWHGNIVGEVGETIPYEYKKKLYKKVDHTEIEGPFEIDEHIYIIVYTPLEFNDKYLGTGITFYSGKRVINLIQNIVVDMDGFEQIILCNSMGCGSNLDSENLFVNRFGLWKDSSLIDNNSFVFEDKVLMNINKILHDNEFSYINESIYAKKIMKISNMRYPWNIITKFDKSLVFEKAYKYINKLIGLMILLSILAAISLRIILRPIMGKLIMNEKELEATIKGNLNQLNNSWEIIHKNRSQMIESKKQRSIARLIQGLAHKINTPMGVILTSNTFNSEMIKDMKDKLEVNHLKKNDFELFIDGIAESTDLIERNSDSIISLIDKLKYLSDDHKQKRYNIQLSETIGIIVEGLSKELKKYQFKIDVLCPEEIYYYGYSEDFVQIVTNLILNSMQHGKIMDRENKILIKVHKHENYIYIEYNDNGKGISHDNIDKIFDPYFTTSFGKGNGGLGLYIVESIVKNNLNGFISCSSTEHVETIFMIRFPI